MELKVDYDGSTARVTIVGDIDDDGANKLKAKLIVLAGQNLTEVIFDFAKVRFIGSTGIGKMLLFYKNLAAKGGRLSVINMNEDLHAMFSVIKLDKVFNISV